MRSSPTAVPYGRLDAAYLAFKAAQAELLTALAEEQTETGWQSSGATSFVAWLSSRWNESYRTVCAWVETARSLSQRPALSDAYRDGAVSCDQMQALSKLCRPGTDDDQVWLESLHDWRLTDLQREARKETARELDRQDGGRYLRLDATPDERFVRIKGQVHPEEGALLMNAIDRAVPDETPYERIDRARVDGLVALARVAVAEDADPDRATVVVHVSEGSLMHGVGPAELPDGIVGAETAMRLACDARVETVRHGADGAPIGIGRASRTVPPWLYRQLRFRDRTCVFPGCERTRFLHAHHVIHWARGGRTDLDNLVLVCTHHHELVHEKRWRLEGEAGPRIRWIEPRGKVFNPRPLAMASAYDTS